MLPDCVAMELAPAEALLKAAGILKIEVLVTQPPRGGIPQGVPRVVRQRQLPDNAYQLVIAYREYVRENHVQN